MTNFHDLFRQPTRPIDGTFPADRRSELFPQAIGASRKLHLWFPGQPITEHGSRLLIGIATWSGYDLNLLDLIESTATGTAHIDVFDIDRCQSIEELYCYIPNIEPPSHTPVVGLWVDGTLVENASSYHGRQLVTRVCNLDPAAVEARMKSVLSRR